MKHLFLSYELSLLAKEKGFDEECFGAYFQTGNNDLKYPSVWQRNSTLAMGEQGCTAPLYPQIIDWFREAHDIHVEVMSPVSNSNS